MVLSSDGEYWQTSGNIGMKQWMDCQVWMQQSNRHIPCATTSVENQATN